MSKNWRDTTAGTNVRKNTVKDVDEFTLPGFGTYRGCENNLGYNFRQNPQLRICPTIFKGADCGCPAGLDF
jgi:hypothetical protein